MLRWFSCTRYKCCVCREKTGSRYDLVNQEYKTDVSVKSSLPYNPCGPKYILIFRIATHFVTYFMHRSRKFCQRGSNFDIFLVDGGGRILIPL